MVGSEERDEGDQGERSGQLLERAQGRRLLVSVSFFSLILLRKDFSL